jgi:SsrA-binding protein
MEIKNRSVYFEYFIDDKYVAGMILLGTEVKSLREGKANFNDSYCLFQDGEIWIKSFHISPYSHGTVNNHDPFTRQEVVIEQKGAEKTTSQDQRERLYHCSIASIFQ